MQIIDRYFPTSKGSTLKYRLHAVLILFSLTLVAGVLVSAQTVPPATFTPAVSSVIQQDIFVRAGPGRAYIPVGSLKAGDRVRPLSRNAQGDWILIAYYNGYGWIRTDLAYWVENITALPIIDEANLTPSPAVPPTQATLILIPTETPVGNWVQLLPDVQSGYVRAGPGRTYLRLGQLYTGDTVEPIGRNADTSWIMIRYADGFGWVARNLVRWVDDLESLPTLSPYDLTPTATFTATNTPTNTSTPTATVTSSATPTPSATATLTYTATSTPTFTSTATNTPTLTPSLTPTVTSTSSSTPTATLTVTSRPTATPAPSDTATHTSTVVAVLAVSATPTPLPPTETAMPLSPTATYTLTPPPPTISPVPASATPVPTKIPAVAPTTSQTASPTFTATPIPATPTLTMTQVPPTASLTATPVVPTNTPVAIVPSVTASEPETSSITPTEVPQSATPQPSASATTKPDATQTSAVLDSVTSTPVSPLSGTPQPMGGIPPEALIGGVALLLLLTYAGFYWRGLAGMERYVSGFVIEKCPVCQQGDLVVDAHQERVFGIPRARHTVRCTNCRSVLREADNRCWRYAIDPVDNPELYRRYNGQIVDEETLIELARNPLAGSTWVEPRSPASPPAFTDDDQ